jgi:subtilisin family serine protease
MTTPSIRQFMVLADREKVLPPVRGKRAPKRETMFAGVEKRLRALLGDFGGHFQVVALPSLDWRLELKEPPERLPPAVPELVVSVDVPDLAALTKLRAAVAAANERAAKAAEPEPFDGIGADLSLAGTEYFCPANLDELLFGDRGSAARLTRSRFLMEQAPPLKGKGVNVVVIDEGLDQAAIPHFGGGWAQGTTLPGTTKRGHGLMVARNILDAAPEATLYDVPLIPLRIDNVDTFIASARAAVRQVIHDIAALRGFPRWSGSWVLVNAWAIFDRSTEQPRGDYTENPHHPFNRLIGHAVEQGHDVVFAAGNCGQFCPSRRCGVNDRGPGFSIYGANSHPRVLTVGAVRTDARWLGNSSQGPGQALLSHDKPDLCAPSNFREVDSAFTGNTDEPYVGNTGSPFIANTGTSAACGLAAGIVAALRSHWDAKAVPPDRLRNVLTATARKTEGPGWKGHLGHGVLDAEAAFKSLP